MLDALIQTHTCAAACILEHREASCSFDLWRWCAGGKPGDPRFEPDHEQTIKCARPTFRVLHCLSDGWLTTGCSFCESAIATCVVATTVPCVAVCAGMFELARCAAWYEGVPDASLDDIAPAKSMACGAHLPHLAMGITLSYTPALFPCRLAYVNIKAGYHPPEGAK